MSQDVEGALLPASALPLDAHALQPHPVNQNAVLRALETLDASLSQLILDLQAPAGLTERQERVVIDLRRKHADFTRRLTEVQVLAAPQPPSPETQALVSSRLFHLYEQLFELGGRHASTAAQHPQRQEPSCW